MLGNGFGVCGLLPQGFEVLCVLAFRQIRVEEKAGLFWKEHKYQ